jgi:hypothetical protein
VISISRADEVRYHGSRSVNIAWALEAMYVLYHIEVGIYMIGCLMKITVMIKLFIDKLMMR